MLGVEANSTHRDKEVLGEDTTFRVVGVVTGVPSSGGITNLPRSKSARVQGELRISSD